MKKLQVGIAALAATVLIGVASMAAAEETVLVSMKGPGAGNPFWAAVERGAEEKGAELGVNVVVLAPPSESDVAAQIAQIEDQLAKGVSGIVLAPTDPNALAPVVDEAIADGVPVVFVDTKGSNAGVTYIGTDNQVGAALAAEHICANVAAGSDVASCRASSRSRPARPAPTARPPVSRPAASISSPSRPANGIGQKGWP